MTSLRKSARGRVCTVQFPGVCNHDPSTTVLAHIRKAHVASAGRKGPDICAVIACSSCHDVIDDRVNLSGYPVMRQEVDGYILRGLLRTLSIWSNEGFIRYE